MAIWRDDVVQALELIGGTGSLSSIYDAIQEVRMAELPPSWKAIVRRELEYNSSDSESWQKKYDLFYSLEGLGNGVWGLRNEENLTQEAVDLNYAEATERQQATVYRVLRDTKLARYIKNLHEDNCQICGYSIFVPPEGSYSEAHHIKPLGQPHNGPDISGNIIVLCPNHHAQFDLGAISLEVKEIKKHPDHEIDKQFIDYHNERIFKT